MPSRDGTGPQGLGPLTGRCLGRCPGRNRNSGRFFFGNRNMTENEEKKLLQAELAEIDSERQNIEKRLKKIK